MDEIDAAIGGQARRHSLLEVETDQLAFGGRDLLADDHLKTGVHLAEPQPALDGVVIGDADRTELRFPGELSEVSQSDTAVARVLRVHVHIEPDRIHERESAAVRVPHAKSALNALHFVGSGEREHIDDFAHVVAPSAVAHQKRRPCRGSGIEGRTRNVAGLPGAPDRRREPLLRLLPEFATEIAQPLIGPTRFDHRAKQRTVGPRKNARDLRREVIRPFARERIERTNAVLVLFVHQKPHEVGFVRKLEVEGSDPHACRLANLVNARSVAGLTKDGACGCQKTCALFLRATPRPPGRSVGQSTECLPADSTTQRSCRPLHLEGAVPLARVQSERVT